MIRHVIQARIGLKSACYGPGWYAGARDPLQSDRCEAGDISNPSKFFEPLYAIEVICITYIHCLYYVHW